MSETSQQSRTEQATPRRLDKAQQEGQIAYSSDLVSAIMLLLISIVFAMFSSALFSSLIRPLASFTSMTRWIHQNETNTDALSLAGLTIFIQICFPLAIVVMLTTLLAAGSMTGFRASPKAFKFDPAKLHPKNGAKKIFSSRSLMRGSVAIAKLVVLLAIATAVIYWRRNELILVDASLDTLVYFGWTLAVTLSLSISGGLVAIGIVDFLYQKWKHQQEMKMTRQEVQDEHREDEGDPHMRARLKKLQREMSQRRSLADVPTSTVVITNPTHYAVALKYERGTMGAPQVVAKGADHMAHKIIAIAREHRVAIVQRKPLARALYNSVPIGREIPLELFQAVAEVISYVYNLRRAA